MKISGPITQMKGAALSGYITVLTFKVVLLAFFSSGYQNSLFMPFVEHFIHNLDNSWDYFYLHDPSVEFPYPPFMLYLLSLAYAPAVGLSIKSVLAKNILFKISLLIADLFTTGLLLKMFPQKLKEIFIYYFCSPIIIYGIYIHSQLDLIPASLLFLSVYIMLKGRIRTSAAVFGLAISTKFYVAASLPLIIIYLLKSRTPRQALYFITIPVAVYLFFAFPYIQSPGYYHLVLTNPKQMQLFDVTHNVRDLSVYLPVLAVFLTYARFSVYRKINEDLLYTFLVLLFSLFVLLIYPAPAWYVWMFPFLSIFFIKFSAGQKLMPVYIMLNVAYCAFFVFLFIPDHQDIVFLTSSLEFKIFDVKLRNIVYTGFEATLMGCVYIFYKYGIRSNSVYSRASSTIVGISGDSGSGKSTLLKSLKSLLGEKMLELEGDGEHKWERHDKNWESFTHLNPKSNQLHYQANYLLALKRGNSIFRRDYDHATGKFTAPYLVEPRDFIVLSGLHPLYLPIMRKAADLKIYMDTDDALRKHWKIIRDTGARGYSRERILQQLEQRSEDARKYIYPQKSFADMIIKFYTDQPFAIGDPQAVPLVKLKVFLDSSVHLEDMIEALNQRGCDIVWEYADDLMTQHLILCSPVETEVVREVASEIIVNMSEIVAADCEWQEGYLGFIQLVFLLALSERIKGDSRDL